MSGARLSEVFWDLFDDNGGKIGERSVILDKCSVFLGGVGHLGGVAIFLCALGSLDFVVLPYRTCQGRAGLTSCEMIGIEAGNCLD